MNELKNCPFCGGSASLARCGFGTGRVTCMNCGAEGSYCQRHDQAIAAWNTRAAPKADRKALTEAEINRIRLQHPAPWNQTSWDFVRAIEAAHGITQPARAGGKDAA